MQHYKTILYNKNKANNDVQYDAGSNLHTCVVTTLVNSFNPKWITTSMEQANLNDTGATVGMCNEQLVVPDISEW